MGSTRLTPSRAWYMLVGILIVLAAAVAAGALIASIRQIDFRPVTVPGETDINVLAQGTWLVCIESTNGTTPVLDDGVQIEFLNPATGTTVPMRERSFPLTYRLGGTRGVSMGDVTLLPGSWVVVSTLLEGASPRQAGVDFVVGPDPVESITWTMLISGVIAVALCSFALGTWCLVFMLRWRNRRAA